MAIPQPMTPDALRSDVNDSLRQFYELAASLPDAAWSAPTDCPGWDVHDVVAHVMTFESMLAGASTPEVDFDDTHVRNDIGRLNEAWVESVRSLPHHELLAQLAAVVARRESELAAMADDEFDELGWSPVGEVPTSRFLQVRVMDVWFHEQDIREAIGRPGGMDRNLVERVLSEVANVVGFVVAKRAAMPDGSSVRFQVEIPALNNGVDGAEVGAVGDGDRAVESGEPVAPVVIDVEVDAGRAVVVFDPIAEPTVTIACDAATFTRLVGARQAPAQLVAAGRVAITGDVAHGQRVLDGLGYMI